MPAIFHKLEKLKPMYDMTYKVLMFLCKVLLIGDIVITAWAVAGRYIPFISDPHWSEEMVLTLMVYMAVLSATLAIRKRTHIRMTAFDQYLPPLALKVSDLLADLVVFGLGLLLLVYGISLCASPLGLQGRYASIPTLSKLWQYLSVPVAGLGMMIFEIEQIFLRVKAFFEKDEKEAAQ